MLGLAGRGRGGGESRKVGGAKVEGAWVGKEEGVVERTDRRGGSAVNCLKVELKMGCGVLTLPSGGKMFLAVLGDTLWVWGSGLTELLKIWDGGGRVGRGRGVVWSGACPWSLAAARTSAFTRGTLPSGRTSGPENGEGGAGVSWSWGNFI